MNLPPDISFAAPEVKAHYISMIEDGQTPAFAEMCALRQPPGTKGTDRTLMEGRYNGEWLDDMPPHQARRILRQAKEAGIDTTGKFYMSGLADKRSHMDPEAWIDSAADIKRVAEKRNLDVRGAVNHTATPAEPKSKKISKRAEERLIKAYMKKDSKLTRQEARDVVRQNHVPRWKK
jgi:hypothetical protein